MFSIIIVAVVFSLLLLRNDFCIGTYGQVCAASTDFAEMLLYRKMFLLFCIGAYEQFFVAGTDSAAILLYREMFVLCCVRVCCVCCDVGVWGSVCVVCGVRRVGVVCDV